MPCAVRVETARPSWAADRHGGTMSRMSLRTDQDHHHIGPVGQAELELPGQIGGAGAGQAVRAHPDRSVGMRGNAPGQDDPGQLGRGSGAVADGRRITQHDQRERSSRRAAAPGRVPSRAVGRPGRRRPSPCGSRTCTRWSASRCCARVPPGTVGGTRVPSASAASIGGGLDGAGGDSGPGRSASTRALLTPARTPSPAIVPTPSRTPPGGRKGRRPAARARRGGKMLTRLPPDSARPVRLHGARTGGALLVQHRFCRCHARQIG